MHHQETVTFIFKFLCQEQRKTGHQITLTALRWTFKHDSVKSHGIWNLFFSQCIFQVANKWNFVHLFQDFFIVYALELHSSGMNFWATCSKKKTARRRRGPQTTTCFGIELQKRRVVGTVANFVFAQKHLQQMRHQLLVSFVTDEIQLGVREAIHHSVRKRTMLYPGQKKRLFFSSTNSQRWLSSAESRHSSVWGLKGNCRNFIWSFRKRKEGCRTSKSNGGNQIQHLLSPHQGEVEHFYDSWTQWSFYLEMRSET